MHVIVVGAGPSGLLLSLMLARAGIKVTLLDAAPTIDSRPRAAHYGPCAVRELARAGVLDDIRAEGFIPSDMSWRRLDGSLIVKLNDAAQKNNPEALTVLHIADFLRILLKHVEAQDNVDIRWESEVIDVKQDSSSVKAIVKQQGGSEREIKGDYLCGCDGGASRVRKTLFGPKFEGKTWPIQLIATNVYYDFEKHGYTDMNFIMHPEHFYMAARITRDGLWRVSYGEPLDLSEEKIRENQPKKYEIMLPGHPKPEEYKLVSMYPYRQHQRCAEKFRVGRVCLAADAAHVCNPWGGLGITGGIVDVGGLADCLVGIAEGKVDESILDKYDEIRRHMYQTIIDPISSSNFLRVSAADPEKAEETDEGIELFRRANKDPEVKKQVDEGAYAVCHDFTQYYKDRVNGAMEAGLTT